MYAVALKSDDCYGDIHAALYKKHNSKLHNSAKTTDPVIFTESIFPQIFSTTAMENYTESQESYESLFKDKNKYNAIMSALAGVIYREMRTQNSDNPNP